MTPVFLEAMLLGIVIAMSLELCATKSRRAVYFATLAWLALAAVVGRDGWITLWYDDCGGNCYSDARLFVGGAAAGIVLAAFLLLRFRRTTDAFDLGRAIPAGLIAAVPLALLVRYGAT